MKETIIPNTSEHKITCKLPHTVEVECGNIGETLLYVNLSPEEALISAYFYQNNMVSKLHDSHERSRVKQMIVETDNTLRIGKMSVTQTK